MLQGFLRSDGRKDLRNILVVAYLVEGAHHVARARAALPGAERPPGGLRRLRSQRVG
jgi:hypothetical protein